MEVTNSILVKGQDKKGTCRLEIKSKLKYTDGNNSYCVHIFSDEKHDKIWTEICSNWRSLYVVDYDLQLCRCSSLCNFNFIGLQLCRSSSFCTFNFVYLQLCRTSILSVFNSVFFKFVASTLSDSTSSSTTLSPTPLNR
jgi:hypothetical protein